MNQSKIFSLLAATGCLLLSAPAEAHAGHGNGIGHGNRVSHPRVNPHPRFTARFHRSRTTPSNQAAARVFECGTGDASVSSSSCGQQVAINPGGEGLAGVRITFSPSVSMSTFSYDSPDGCSPNLFVVFNNGNSSQTICSCDVATSAGNCDSTRYTYQFSQTANITSIDIYGSTGLNDPDFSTSVFNFRLNNNAVGGTINPNPTDCPSLPDFGQCFEQGGGGGG